MKADLNLVADPGLQIRGGGGRGRAVPKLGEVMTMLLIPWPILVLSRLMCCSDETVAPSMSVPVRMRFLWWSASSICREINTKLVLLIMILFQTFLTQRLCHWKVNDKFFYVRVVKILTIGWFVLRYRSSEHDGVQQESSCYFGHCTQMNLMSFS